MNKALGTYGTFQILVGLLGLVFLPPASASDCGNVEVWVTERETGKPVASCRTYISGSLDARLTNDDGWVCFPEVPIGVYTFAAGMRGYGAEHAYGVRVFPNATVTLYFEMERKVTVDYAPRQPRREVTAEKIRSFPEPGVAEILRWMKDTTHYRSPVARGCYLLPISFILDDSEDEGACLPDIQAFLDYLYRDAPATAAWCSQLQDDVNSDGKVNVLDLIEAVSRVLLTETK